MTEIDQQPITQVAGQIAIKAADRFGTDRLVGSDHFAQLFGIELLGKSCRANQVAKHHRQLAALGFGRLTPGCRRFAGRGLVWLLLRLLGESGATFATELEFRGVLKATIRTADLE